MEARFSKGWKFPLPHQHFYGGVWKSLTLTKERVRRSSMLFHILRVHQIFPAAIPHPDNLVTYHVENMLGVAVVLFAT